MLHFSSYAVASNSMIWSLNKCWVWKNNIWSFFIRPPVWICSLVFKVNVSCLILEFFIGSVGTLEQNCVNGLKLYVPLGILKAKQSCWTAVLKLEGLCSSQTLFTFTIQHIPEDLIFNVRNSWIVNGTLILVAAFQGIVWGIKEIFQWMMFSFHLRGCRQSNSNIFIVLLGGV